MSECFAKIEAQQAKLTENSAPWVVGEQLKDICTDSYCAELVSADLDNADMSLTNCEKKIKAYADKHTVHTLFAPYIPAETIENIREYDVSALESVIGG